MSKSKKIISMILVFTLLAGFCFSLSACGSKNTEKNKTPTVEDTTVSSGEENPTENTNNETTQPLETTPNVTNPTDAEAGTNPTETTNPSDENEKENENQETKPTENETQNTPTEPSESSGNNRPVIRDETDVTLPQGGGNGGESNVQPAVKDETVFSSYDSFYSNNVVANNHTFSKEPVIEDLTSKCDCKINFSGTLRSGSISVQMDGENMMSHAHGWNTPIGAKPSAIANACDSCGFVKGENFIYVKLKGKDHGHGWSWPIEIPNNVPDVCACGYTLTGNYDNGSVVIKLNGEEHGHMWATSSNQITPIYTASGDNGSIDFQAPVFFMPPPKCTDCMFFKYAQSGIGYIRIKCGLDNTKTHVMTYVLNDDADTHESNCSCKFTFTGDYDDGSYSMMIKGVSHSHAWASSPVLGGASNKQNMLDKMNCSTCNFVRTKSGFSVLCPDTGLRHIVNFDSLNK